VRTPESPARLAWYGCVVLLAVFSYFYGLDGLHIPKNGDEFPYEHITRLTGASGHLLPLESQLEGMRNTKPPMLVWQGIASTGGARHWTLWHLRVPSVIYSLLTALLVFLLARKLSGSAETGFVGALCYLAFFSTYRYGRPFLTNPPEAFWLFLPFFALLYWRPAAFESRLAPFALGAAIGIGTLYKSFALVAPVTLGLAWWYLHQRRYRPGEFLVRDAWKVCAAAAIALGVFGLWFAFDPDPRAIWNEFVLHENIGKIGAQSGSYLGNLLWGESSMWSLALDYPFNAGLLAFPVALLFLVAFRRRREMDDAEKLLWIWVLSLFLVFSLPSQRSGRYLLSAMPAIAVLAALNWQRIGRWTFIASLASAGAIMALIAWLSLRLEQEMAGAQLYPAWHWILLAGEGVLVAVAILLPRFTRQAVCAVIFLAFVSFAAFLRPLDGDLGSFPPEVRRFAEGKPVGVPCKFRADFEQYRFVLPGADVQGYRESRNLGVAELGARFPVFVVQTAIADAPCAGCKILGTRLNLRGRLSAGETREMLRGKVFENLFAKEILVESPGVAAGAAPIPARESCR
jgi:4-amino-4-deoxy-L-arabinose transferase-like glycosyltransferase